jgi:hypothetical protein
MGTRRVMSYTVNSEIFALGKKGASISTKELQDAGCNIEALVAAGHLISAKSASKLATESETE